jgi:hypothetical protein
VVGKRGHSASLDPRCLAPRADELQMHTCVATTRCVVIRTPPLNVKLLVSLQKNSTA